MSLIMTALWVILVAIMYYVGRNEGYAKGVGDGTWFTLDALRKQHIIHIDEKTEAISPGSASPSTMGQVINRIK
jgi:hypothetical protein